MKRKLAIVTSAILFLSGCQLPIQDSQSSVDNLNEETVIDSGSLTEQPTENDSAVIDSNQEGHQDESVDCPVSSTLNEAIAMFDLTMSENQLAAIVHTPTESQLTLLDDLDVIEFNQDSSDEQILIIPQYIGARLTIYEVFYEDDQFIEKMPLMETQIVEDKQVIDLNCLVPEGIPNLKILVEYKDYKGQYLVSYDGSGERPQIEYLESED